MSRSVARPEASAGGRYPPPGLSPDSTDRGLDSVDRLQLPSPTNKAFIPRPSIIYRYSKSHELQRPKCNLPEPPSVVNKNVC